MPAVSTDNECRNPRDSTDYKYPIQTLWTLIVLLVAGGGSLTAEMLPWYKSEEVTAVQKLQKA
jgi:hypothetical protein